MAADLTGVSARPRTPARTDRNGLEVLGREACLALLARSRLGRLAYVSNGSARVVPINYTMSGDTPVFRIGTGGLLAAVEEGQLVSLEVDSADTHTRSGWSVVVTGHAHEVLHRPDRLPAGGCSWLRADASRLVRLTPLEISGRRLSPVTARATAPHAQPATRPRPRTRSR